MYHIWILTYVIQPKNLNKACFRSRTVRFVADSDDASEQKALSMALKKLKTALRRMKKENTLGIVMLNRRSDSGALDKTYGIRDKFLNRNLLKIRDPHRCFVEGTGGAVLEELRR